MSVDSIRQQIHTIAPKHPNEKVNIIPLRNIVVLKNQVMNDQMDSITNSSKIDKNSKDNVTFRCKSIRIGSYRCNMENYKKDAARLEEGGVMFKVPPNKWKKY